MNAKEKLRKARTQLVLDEPFFGSLVLKLALVESNEIDTATVNGKRIRYNPAFIDSLTLAEAKAVLAHEVLHVANLHHTRIGNRDLPTWNKATDYAINPILTDCGFTLPAGVLNDPARKGKAAETIYSEIAPAPQPDPEQTGDDDQTGDDGDDGNGERDDDETDEEQTGGDGDGEQDDADGDAAPDPDPGGMGGIDPPDDPNEIPALEQQAKCDVAQAAAVAKAQGKLPAALDQFVEELLHPKADWRELLRRFIESNSRNDYTWKRPNARYAHTGFVLPSLISDELPPVAVAIDTSGSCWNLQEQFLSELSEMLRQHRTHATVLYVDAAIAHVAEFESDDLPIPLETHGGGGTSFRPPFEWIEANGLTPACLIYLTDLWGDFPETAPDYPVLWATGQSGHQCPPWGDWIKLMD